jgi:large subunit ribosomal protein L21e
MPAGHGVRARTRDLFARPFRKKGYIPLSTYLRTFKVGDYVDVKVNGAIHKFLSLSSKLHQVSSAEITIQ